MPTNYVMEFEHALEPLMGWDSELNQLQFAAKLSSVTVKDPVYAGSVVHLNASKEFEPGATGKMMPIFLFKGSDSFDVANPGGTRWLAVFPTGKLTGVVAQRGYEVGTTEFDTTDTYAPNDILHSPTEAIVGSGNENEAGKLYRRKSWTGGANAALTLYTNNVCGVVSTGKATNQHNVSMLSLWTVYLPGSGS